MNFETAREELIERLVRNGYLKSRAVIEAMRKVPRELFVPTERRESAYEDRPLPIGNNQTISAPHMNAMMCELLELREGMKIFEVGTGSGYHAALCAEIVNPGGTGTGHVHTVERHRGLYLRAREVLESTGYASSVTVYHGDGTKGCKRHAPFDRILVTAAGPDVPPPLEEQLADGGIICIPVGRSGYSQDLYVVKKEGGVLRKKRICGVAFVPLVGEFGFPS
ncbi:MAG: protein-L-isoaspartate O-methyltransferase [Promethearchaeota archaeon]